MNKHRYNLDMGMLLTTERGKILLNGRIIDDVKSFIPDGKYGDGNLRTGASLNNLLSVSESILEFFIRPKGYQLKPDPDRDYRYRKLDVVGKYSDGSLPPKRNEGNLTRGWCALVSGVLHRFFWNEYDFYRIKCPLTTSEDDYHWWLESKCRNHVIDLTDEQYLKVGVKTIRDGGEKRSSLPMASMKYKVRNMAFIVATHNEEYDSVNFDDLKYIGYKK